MTYLPLSLKTRYTPDVWKQKIFQEHANLVGQDEDQAKDNYLKLAQTLPLYGSAIFTDLSAKDAALVNLPVNFELAINFNGLHVLEKTTMVIF